MGERKINGTFLVILAVMVSIIFMIVGFWLIPVALIIKGLTAGLPVLPLQLISMRLRNVNPHMIVNNAVALIMAKAPLSDYEKKNLLTILESHHLAGGNVARVTAAMIEGLKRDETLSLNQAMAIDLQLSYKK